MNTPKTPDSLLNSTSLDIVILTQELMFKRIAVLEKAAVKLIEENEEFRKRLNVLEFTTTDLSKASGGH